MVSFDRYLPRWTYAALLCCVTVLFFVPLRLYLRNVVFEAAPVVVVAYLAILAICGTATLLAIGLVLPFRSRDALSALVFGVGFGAWAVSSFGLNGVGNSSFFAELAPLDGGSNVFWQTVLAAAVVAGAMFAWFRLRRHTKKIVVYVLVVQAISTIVGVFEGKGNSVFFNNGGTVVNSERMHEFSRSKHNTLVLIVDSASSEVVSDILSSDDDLLRKFAGFTSFTDTVSMYNSTNLAIPGLLSGKYYRGEETLEEYYSYAFASSASLLEISRAKGIAPSVLSFLSYYVIGDSKHALGKQIGDVIQHGVVSNNIVFNNLVELAVSQVLPTPLSDQYLAWLTKNGRIFSTQRKWDSKFFERFRAELSDTSPQPTFHFYHITGAHRPYLDDDSRPIERRLENTYANYRVHAHRSVRAVAQMLDELRERDLLDNTTVFLVGDHGTPETRRKANPAPHLMPVLMVKPARSSHPYVENGAPMSLKDLYSLVVESFDNGGLSDDDLADFVTRVSSGRSERRSLTFNSLVFDRHFKDRALQLREYAVRGRATLPDSWSLIGDIEDGVLNPIIPLKPVLGERIGANRFLRGRREGVSLSGEWSISEPAGVWTIGNHAQLYIPGDGLPREPFILRIERTVNADAQHPMIVSYKSIVGVLRSVLVQSADQSETDSLLITHEMRDADGGVTLSIELERSNPGRQIEGEESRKEVGLFLRSVAIMPAPRFRVGEPVAVGLGGRGELYLGGEWGEEESVGRWIGNWASLRLWMADEDADEPLVLAINGSPVVGRGVLKVRIGVGGETLLRLVVMPGQSLPTELMIPAEQLKERPLLDVKIGCEVERPLPVRAGRPTQDLCLFLNSFALRKAPVYGRGGQMTFSKDGSGLRSLHGSWRAAEAAGSWSLGRASIHVPFVDKWRGPLRLVFRGEVNLHGLQSRTVRLRLNNHELPDWQFETGRTSLSYLDIPPDLVEGIRSIELELECLETGGNPLDEGRCVFMQGMSIE